MRTPASATLPAKLTDHDRARALELMAEAETRPRCLQGGLLVEQRTIGGFSSRKVCVWARTGVYPEDAQRPSCGDKRCVSCLDAFQPTKEPEATPRPELHIVDVTPIEVVASEPVEAPRPVEPKAEIARRAISVVAPDGLQERSTRLPGWAPRAALAVLVVVAVFLALVVLLQVGSLMIGRVGDVSVTHG